MNPLNWLRNILVKKPSADKPTRELALEAKIGGTVFGPVPENVIREFFCLDRNTWIWHEVITDNNGNANALTTRYDVRNDGVYKAQNGSAYSKVSLNEAKNLHAAAELYFEKVKDLYSNKFDLANIQS